MSFSFVSQPDRVMADVKTANARAAALRDLWPAFLECGHNAQKFETLYTQVQQKHDCLSEQHNFGKICLGFKSKAIEFFKNRKTPFSIYKDHERFVEFLNAHEKTNMDLQILWLRLILGDFNPKFIVITFGGYEPNTPIMQSFQIYPGYTRDFINLDENVLIINIDREFTPLHIKKNNSHIFCLSGNFDWAGGLSSFLDEKCSKNTAIIFHSYYAYTQSPLNIEWVEYFWKTHATTSIEILSGYFNDCLNFKLVNKDRTLTVPWGYKFPYSGTSISHRFIYSPRLPENLKNDWKELPQHKDLGAEHIGHLGHLATAIAKKIDRYSSLSPKPKD